MSDPTGAILLVEDEALIRKGLEKLLRLRGYEPIAFGDAEGALEWIATSPSPMLLITDVVLPRGLSGVDVVTTLRARHPDVPVVLMSGYPQNRVSELGLMLDERTFFLSKPFEVSDLLALVASWVRSPSLRRE